MLRFIIKWKGGPGSGHRGHAGRPGSVGGSVPGVGVGGVNYRMISKSEIVEPGVIRYDVLYHGTTNKNLTSLTIDKSKRTQFGAVPAISLSNDSLLSAAFTRGELGLDPEGSIYEAAGPFTVLDVRSSDGRALWDSFDKDPNKLLDAGYDGVVFKNVEGLRISAFYKDIPVEEIKFAKEVQIFRDVLNLKQVPIPNLKPNR